MQVSDTKPPQRGAVRAERVDWAEAKQSLIDNPGKWVLMAENVSGTTSTQIRQGKLKAFRGAELEQFEFIVRKPEDSNYPPKRTDLWGKYTETVGTPGKLTQKRLPRVNGSKRDRGLVQ